MTHLFPWMVSERPDHVSDGALSVTPWDVHGHQVCSDRHLIPFGDPSLTVSRTEENEIDHNRDA